MARIAAKIGYGVDSETRPGIWEHTIVERTLYGDWNTNRRRLENNDQANNTINVANEVSLVADAFAMENFMNIKYVQVNGIKWVAKDVTVVPPRLIIGFGGEYNGQ